MDAARIVNEWKRRLTAMAESPAYVYRDTSQTLIDDDHRRLTAFIGYSELDVAAAESRLGARFPEVFRRYLLDIAKNPGDLFRGSDLAGVDDFERFRADALELMAQTDPALKLPADAVVFLSHQGYTFVYIAAAGGFDAPPMQWTETEREPRQVAAGFAEMVDTELGLMERTIRELREWGGFYKTLRPSGGNSMDFPSLRSGDGPSDPDPPAKRW